MERRALVSRLAGLIIRPSNEAGRRSIVRANGSGIRRTRIATKKDDEEDRTLKAGDRYPATISDIRERLAEQWRRHRYAVTLQQANTLLKDLSQDTGLLEKCAQFKVPITEIIWDMAVATSHRQLLRGILRSKSQAKDTIKKAKKRAPLLDMGDNEALELEDLEIYYRAKHHPAKNAISRLGTALAKYRNAPGKEHASPALKVRGRPEDTSRNWLIEKLMTRLGKVPTDARDDLLCRLLVAIGFHQAGKITNQDEAIFNASDTIRKQAYRLKRETLHTS